MNEVAALKGLIRARRRQIAELEPKLRALREEAAALKIQLASRTADVEAIKRTLQFVIDQQAAEQAAEDAEVWEIITYPENEGRRP